MVDRSQVDGLSCHVGYIVFSFFFRKVLVLNGQLNFVRQISLEKINI
jgi:hypothetical protein